MGLWSPEKCPGILRRGCPLPTARRKEALVPSRWGSACSSQHPERFRVRPLGKEPATWGSAVRKAEWAEVQISGHASELCWGVAPTSTPCNAPPGLRIPRGSSSRGPTQQSRAQRRVTRGPSDTSGLGARKLCPENSSGHAGVGGFFPP